MYLLKFVAVGPVYQLSSYDAGACANHSSALKKHNPEADVKLYDVTEIYETQLRETAC